VAASAKGKNSWGGIVAFISFPDISALYGMWEALMSYASKLLIVDDEPVMCESLKSLLSHAGHEAQTAYSGQEAIEWLAKDDFEIVLLDMHMPGMNGLEIMDYARRHCPETFVIVITGHASLGSAVESLRKGAFDYLKKPFEYEELIKTVKNALHQKRLERDRKRAQEELRKAHEELERRVEERTSELAKANEQLHREIEERKRTVKELHQMTEELKNYVRVASHDLKNPIVSIQGFSSRLARQYEAELGDKGMGYLEHIVACARRMELLVSDLLTLSRIGRIVPTVKEVSAMEIVEDVSSSLKGRLKDKGVEFVSARDLPTMRCDRERMYQVFENLITNAIKFMGDTERPRIEVGYEDRGVFHEFFVRDNGIGIDPQYHRRIFGMFDRLRVVEDEEGTGLGLPIVEKTVDNWGGTVWVESEKGAGATFRFTLPKGLERDEGAQR
jgi:signal transduction histidine kinase